MFTYATVCSGVEGCSLALEGMGWEPIFFSEIEPFPCAVLKYHYPNVPNLGDMSKIRYEAKDGIITNGTTHVRFNGRLDALCGGTPCTDFSVAGKRLGGAEGSGTRSSLMWEWLRLARELRPRILMWENVVGTFSTNGGRDFYELVRAIDEIGYMCQWRVLDAQYTRVDKFPQAIPQRRRRVWLIASPRGDVTEFAKILFEPTSLTGDTPPRRSTRKETSHTSQDGNRSNAPMVGERKRVEGWFDNIRTGFPTTGDDVNHTVCTSSNYQGVIEEVNTPVIAIDGDKLKPRVGQRKGGNGFGISEDNVGYTLTCPDRHGCAYGSRVCSTGKDVASTLSSNDGTQSGQDYNSNSVIETYTIPSMNSNVMKSANPETGVRKVDVASTLDSTMPTPQKNQGGEMVVECFENHPNDSRVKPMGDCCQTLTQRIGTGGGNLPLVATFEPHGQDSRVKPIEDISPTLGTTASNNPLTGNNPLVVEGVENQREKVVGVLDMMGGKTGAHFGDGEVAPTLTHGRGSVSDIHAVASGVTFDAHMGFPTVEDTSQTLKNGSSPGWANGVIAMATKQISQNCETELSPTLTASDYKEPNCIAHKIVEGVDGYNFSQTGDTSATIRGTACDFQHTNGVIVKEPLPQKADNEGLDASN